MHLAALTPDDRHAAVADYLLTKRAKTDIENQAEDTPFDIAVERLSRSMCELMISKAKPDWRRTSEKFAAKGSPLLHKAVIMGAHALTKYLLDHGVKVSKKEECLCWTNSSRFALGE